MTSFDLPESEQKVIDVDDPIQFASIFPKESEQNMSISSDSLSSSILNSDGLHDEPLFWPLDHSLYNFLDFDKFLCPSPFSKEDKHVATNNPQANKKDVRGFRRRVPSNNTSLNSAAKYDSKVQGMSSRLSISTRTTSPDQHPCNVSERRGKPQLKIDVAREDYDCNQLSKEADQLFDCMLERGSIEDVIGLSEFDGREGIDADLEEQLTLLLSPCGNTEFFKGR